jgi:23S rRNA (guanosine2251-2'-O)-methyltransferase
MAEPQWLVGINAVRSALEHNPLGILELLVESGRHDQRVQTLLELAGKNGVSTRRAEKKELQRRFPKERHQGVAASYRVQPMLNEADLAGLFDGQKSPLVLVLDHIEDPGNFGACLRTAAAAGVGAVVFPKDRAVGLTPGARKAASGAAERLPLVQVTNLARTLDLLKDQGFWIAGAAGDAHDSLYDSKLNGPLALVMGSEAKGLKRLVREKCDFLLKIPMSDEMESLNVSVATGIMLFEAVRQRKVAAS